MQRKGITLAQLRTAYGTDPCPRHKLECAIRSSKECSWGHCALEFAERCDACGKKFIKAIGLASFAERVHHPKRRRS